MSKELHQLSISQVSKLLKKKEVSPVELTKICLDRIEEFNPKLNAFIAVYADDAMKQAKKAEREIARNDYGGKLHGVPLAIKDNIYFEGRITTMGSKIHKDFVSDFDATTVLIEQLAVRRVNRQFAVDQVPRCGYVGCCCTVIQ